MCGFTIIGMCRYIEAFIEWLLVSLLACLCEHRDALKARIQVDKAETQYTVTVAQLRLELEQSHAVSEETNKLQAQYRLEIEKLKVALANETANVENERKAKQQAFKER